MLSKDGRVGVMEKEDRLLVTDYAENLAMVEKVLEQIDQPRPQVRITALIYDISLQDIEQLGINWEPGSAAASRSTPTATRTRDTALDVDSIMQVPFQAGAAGSTLTFMNLSRHIDITAVVLALQQASDARLLADPNVAVLENEEAIFESVSEIPYQQLTETQQGGRSARRRSRKPASRCTCGQRLPPRARSRCTSRPNSAGLPASRRATISRSSTSAPRRPC